MVSALLVDANKTWFEVNISTKKRKCIANDEEKKKKSKKSKKPKEGGKKRKQTGEADMEGKQTKKASMEKKGPNEDVNIEVAEQQVPMVPPLVNEETGKVMHPPVPEPADEDAASDEKCLR
jgi:hypothetical protein